MAEANDFLTRVFDPVALARQQALLKGEVAVAVLERLHDVLSETAGALGWSVRGYRRDDGRAVTELRLEGTLSARCPRCLQAAALPVRLERTLVWYRSEAAIPDDELETEEWDARVQDEPVTLLALIEEELLLDWPQGALHEACVLPAEPLAGKVDSPFARFGA